MRTASVVRFAQPRSYWISTLLRGAGFWAAIRVALLFYEQAELGVNVSLVIVATAAALSHGHSRAMKERVFVENLGIGPAALVAPACAAGALELLARLVVG